LLLSQNIGTVCTVYMCMCDFFSLQQQPDFKHKKKAKASALLTPVLFTFRNVFYFFSSQ
jgi:hypothetical protein